MDIQYALSTPKKSLNMFHGASSVLGRPNSKPAIAAALQYPFDIIELDVRKSKDGVLYCYHGGFFARFLKNYTFKKIRERLSADTLEGVLAIIPSKKIIFLDIKDHTITAADLQKIFKKHTHSFWIAATSIPYLRQLKTFFPQHTFVYNFGLFFFNRGLYLAKEAKIDSIKLFGWQCTDKNIKNIATVGLRFSIEELFLTKKRFHQLLTRYGSLWRVVNTPKNFNL